MKIHPLFANMLYEACVFHTRDSQKAAFAWGDAGYPVVEEESKWKQVTTQMYEQRLAEKDARIKELEERLRRRPADMVYLSDEVNSWNAALEEAASFFIGGEIFTIFDQNDYGHRGTVATVNAVIEKIREKIRKMKK